MATAADFAALPFGHFTADEFKHPERIHAPLLEWLDRVREAYGDSLHPTSDARDYVPTGGSDGSLHLQGRAIDLRWLADREARYRFVRAVIETPPPTGEGGIELGLEPGAPGGPHFHVGLRPAGGPFTLFVR